MHCFGSSWDCCHSQSLLNFRIDESSVQLFEGVDYSTEAVKAREKEALRQKRIELLQDVSIAILWLQMFFSSSCVAFIVTAISQSNQSVRVTLVMCDRHRTRWAVVNGRWCLRITRPNLSMTCCKALDSREGIKDPLEPRNTFPKH